MSFALRSTARPVVVARPAVRAARPAGRAVRAVAVRAIAAYPDPDFVAETLEAFPDKMIANVEEARVSGQRNGGGGAGGGKGQGGRARGGTTN